MVLHKKYTFHIFGPKAVKTLKKVDLNKKKKPLNYTLFEIFIFCPKIQLWFPEKIVDFLGWKTRENVVVLDFLAVDNFDLTRKIVKKKIEWKLVNIEFLDKNLTFRIVWRVDEG